MQIYTAHWHVFRDIYYLLWKSLGQQLGEWSQLPRMERKIKLPDSSTITLSLKAFPWARYTHEKGAVKLHTLLDLEYDAPSYICVSDGKMAACKGALHIPVRNDMLIVADRGYMDFELLKHWDSKGARFVVRHTKSIRYTTIQEWDLPPDSAQNILKDEIIFMCGVESHRIQHHDRGACRQYEILKMRYPLGRRICRKMLFYLGEV